MVIPTLHFRSGKERWHRAPATSYKPSAGVIGGGVLVGGSLDAAAMAKSPSAIETLRSMAPCKRWRNRGAAFSRDGSLRPRILAHM